MGRFPDVVRALLSLGLTLLGCSAYLLRLFRELFLHTH